MKLDQLLFPPRLFFRAFDDLHRMADAAVSAAGTLRWLRDDMDALRDAFAGADAELERIRKTFGPEIDGIRRSAFALHEDVRGVHDLLKGLDGSVTEMGHRLTGEVAALHATIRVLVREADEMRKVVEPLQGATERVGRVADRLPGGSS